MPQTPPEHEVNREPSHPPPAVNTSAHVKERPQVQTSAIKSPSVETKATTPTTVANKTKSSSPLRQSIPTLLLACLAVASYSLTICYAVGTTGLRYLPFTRLDPSKTLTVLRTLSEVTSVLLWPLISLCTERVLWMIVARRNGTRLSTFLSLHPGSGPWAWIQMILKNIQGGRSLSWAKLAISLIPPAMGVALLSQVDIGLYFDGGSSFPVAAGVGDFNASYASDFAQVAPVYMASDFLGLLQSRDVSWDVPVVAPDRHDCTSSDVFSSNACGSGYFLHGGLKLVTPWPTENTTSPTDPIYTIHSIRGLQLDLTSLMPGASFQPEQDCLVLGTDNSAIQICISQYSQNTVNAKHVHCPLSLVGSCLKNTTWQASTGWTATMTAYTRKATVHFSRANLSTIAVSNPSLPTSYPISATSLLSVYNTTLNSRTGLGSASTSAGQFISFVSTYLTFAETSSPTTIQASLALHNLMAMPLYYFQPTYLSPFTLVPSPNTILSNLPSNQQEFLVTTATLSTSYYGLRVAKWSLYVYGLGIGVLLAVCVAVLVLGCLPRGEGKGIPDTTPWSFVDYAAECDVFETGVYTENHRVDAVATGDLMQKIKTASVATGSSNDSRGSTARVLRGMRVRLRSR